MAGDVSIEYRFRRLQTIPCLLHGHIRNKSMKKRRLIMVREAYTTKRCSGCRELCIDKDTPNHI